MPLDRKQQGEAVTSVIFLTKMYKPESNSKATLDKYKVRDTQRLEDLDHLT